MLSDDLIKRTKKSVKNYKDKQRILRNKGVSSSALTKIGTAGELLKAFENDPKGLRRRLNELDRFSTKGKVYKSKGGLNLTATVKNFKNREIKKSASLEQELYDKSSRSGLSSARYHKNRLERLQKDIETVTASDIRSLNYAITTPEDVKMSNKVAVQNFMKGINFGLGGMDNDTFYGEELGKRIRKNLSELTEDELVDLLENNRLVNALMNYYREKDKILGGEPIEFSGGTMDDLLMEFYQQLPEIVRSYKRRRK